MLGYVMHCLINQNGGTLVAGCSCLVLTEWDFSMNGYMSMLPILVAKCFTVHSLLKPVSMSPASSLSDRITLVSATFCLAFSPQASGMGKGSGIPGQT